MIDFKNAIRISNPLIYIPALFLIVGSFSFGTYLNESNFDRNTFSQILVALTLILILTTALLLVLIVRYFINLHKNVRAIAAYAQSLRAYTVPRLNDIEKRIGDLGLLDAPAPPLKEISITDANDKPLSTRERNTHLVIIAALCKDAGYDINKNAKTAGLILRTATSMGLQIGESTIEGVLKKIPDALESRTK